MSVLDQARAALAAIAAAHSSAAVTVVDAAGASATGVRGTHPDAALLEQAGVGGQGKGIVRVSAEALTFARGAHVTVGGALVTVDVARLDPAGACWTVEYTELPE